MSNEKCTTTLSNPCEVDKIVKVTRKEKLSTKEDYLIAQYEVDKYHLKDKKIRKSIQISKRDGNIKSIEHSTLH